MMSVPNEELEQMVKQLNGKSKVLAWSFLSWLIEKQLDEEDDLLTTEDIKFIEQARLDLQNKETISLEYLKSELRL